MADFQTYQKIYQPQNKQVLNPRIRTGRVVTARTARGGGIIKDDPAPVDGSAIHCYKPVKKINFMLTGDRVVLDVNQVVDGKPTKDFKDGYRLIEFYFDHDGKAKKKVLSAKYFREVDPNTQNSADGETATVIEPIKPTLEKKIHAFLTLTGMSIGLYLAYKKEAGVLGYIGYGLMGVAGGSLIGWVARRNIVSIITPTGKFERE